MYTAGIDCDVISGGDLSANALIYRPLSQNTLAYLKSGLDNTLNAIKGVGQSFVDTVRGMYDRYNSIEAVNRAKMVLYNAGQHLSQDVIYPVRYDNYNNLNLTMQQYVMAYPEVDRMYRKNKCYGFADTYIDPEPGTCGEDRFSYQRVMDGMLQFDAEGEGYFRHYSNSDDAPELTMLEKLSVLETWDTVARLIGEGVDPTHPDGESL